MAKSKILKTRIEAANSAPPKRRMIGLASAIPPKRSGIEMISKAS